MAGRFEPDDVLRPDSSRAGPTYFSAVPTIYTMLCGLPDDVQPDTSSVRFAVCGAAPASVELLERFESRYGIPIIEGYGLSEGTCASTVNPLDGPRKPGTVGLPLPGQTIRIVDAAGRPVPDGEAGEVVIKGANVMRGYLNRPEETAKTVVDGWLHTGDIGRFDEDGYLVLVDRAKDMIIRGGENIYPREIEAVVHQLPQIAEAAVVGRTEPGLRRGAGAVRVAARPNATRHPEAIREHIAGQLVEIQTAGRDHDPRRPAQEPRRQDRQTRLCAGCSSELARYSHIDKRELIMGFTKPDFPAGRSGHLPAKPLMERMRILAQHWVENGFGSPRMVHTIYIVKLVLLLRPRRRARGDGDVGSAGVLARRGVVEPADRLPEGRPVDGAAGGDRRRRVVGPAGRQGQADDRRHPVLGPAGHHPAAAVEVGAVHRR